MSRYGFGITDDHQPVTWWRGYPIFAAHFIVVVFCASMLLTTVMLFAGVGHWLGWLAFDSALVLRGQVWRILTYGLVNQPSIEFALDMLMIVWFGREVEQHFGRRRFFGLYAGIYLVTPVLFSLLGFWTPRTFAGETGAFALFVAFATLHPNAPLLFNILAKWAALVLVGIFALMALAARNWVQLIELGATCGLAYGFVRWQQGELRLPSWGLRKRQPPLRVLPDLPAGGSADPKGPGAAGAGGAMAEVDALLDKIARSGIRSLTAEERARLEAARADLLKRDAGRR
ncbi:MAG: rhomboid family intramembrane serine protease [Verrucomicrobia bacterium]|nr:rhomboid family intramembrane serine protease [Verrucomicrobiota bacterium]